jgi:hypothetical protein
MKYLNRDFPTRWGCGSGKDVTIPKGTPVIPATNIPGDWYWVDLQDDGTFDRIADADMISWSQIYGFKVGNLQVCDSPSYRRGDQQ